MSYGFDQQHYINLINGPLGAAATLHVRTVFDGTGTNSPSATGGNLPTGTYYYVVNPAPSGTELGMPEYATVTIPASGAVIHSGSCFVSWPNLTADYYFLYLAIGQDQLDWVNRFIASTSNTGYTFSTGAVSARTPPTIQGNSFVAFSDANIRSIILPFYAASTNPRNYDASMTPIGLSTEQVDIVFLTASDSATYGISVTGQDEITYFNSRKKLDITIPYGVSGAYLFTEARARRLVGA